MKTFLEFIQNNQLPLCWLCVTLICIFIWKGKKRNVPQRIVTAEEMERARISIEDQIYAARTDEHLKSVLNLIENFKGMYCHCIEGKLDYVALLSLFRIKAESLCPELLSDNEQFYVSQDGRLMLEVMI